MSKKDSLIKDALILFAITLIAALALGFVYEITKEPIAKAQEEAKVAAYKKVFPELASTYATEELTKETEGAGELFAGVKGFESASVREVLIAADESGKALGYVMTVCDSGGYGGDIVLAMGIAADGTLKGIEFLTLAETAGLGMKAKEPEFTEQFNQVKAKQFSLAKAGIQGDVEVEAISSATITTTSVVRAVNAGLYFAEYLTENGAGGAAYE